MSDIEERRKLDGNGLQKKHFSSIHEKIQNKLEEMQKKMERSKSMSSLSHVSSSNECINENLKFTSSYDLSEIDNLRNSEITTIEQFVIEEEMQDIVKVYEDIEEPTEFNEAILFNPEPDIAFSHMEFEHKTIEDKLIGDDLSKTSLESLVSATDNEIYITTTTSLPSPTSLRDKIKQRFFKRRRIKKDKKSECRDSNKEPMDKLFLSNTLKPEIAKVVKRIKTATVTIALIECTGLESENTEEKNRFLQCRFKLGTEKFKSKVVKCNGPTVQWQELFNFNLYEDDVVTITLFDKDNFIGRCNIDLLEQEKEKTHKMRISLEDDMSHIQIFILLTISGTTLVNAVIDLHDYIQTQKKMDKMRKNVAWYRMRNEDMAVGYLSIIVYGAKGLSGNDCYCVLELDNERLQTHTEFKTNNPNWMKSFIFTLSDITSILELTVYDEKRSDIVGKVAIQLLSIENEDTKWYALKDYNLRERAKGNNPRILLEIKLTWQLIKSSMRVFSPKEVKYLEIEKKLDRHLFARNLSRAKSVWAWIAEAFKITKTCFEWDSWRWNVVGLTFWLLMCWFFKAWMLPLLLLLPFVWYRPPKYFLFNWKQHVKKVKAPGEIEEKDEKNLSLRQKINSLQDMIQSVQNFIGKWASVGESIKNLYNFSVPYLSFLAIFVIIMLSFIIYLVPIRYIFMLWGIHKFTRKILRPNRIPNNEILDLLSRVPDDDTLLDCEQLPLDNLTDED